MTAYEIAIAQRDAANRENADLRAKLAAAEAERDELQGRFKAMLEDRNACIKEAHLRIGDLALENERLAAKLAEAMKVVRWFAARKPVSVSHGSTVVHVCPGCIEKAPTPEGIGHQPDCIDVFARLMVENAARAALGRDGGG